MESRVNKQKDQSIGWYTLAQMVSSKEKERAMGVLRLLTYSFNDEAFGQQIAGDLLRAFDDPEAFIKYQQAARLYREGGRLMSAIGVYEHLFFLEPKGYDYCMMLIELYAQVGQLERLKNRCDDVRELHAQGIVRTDQVQAIIKKAKKLLNESDSKILEKQFDEWLAQTMPAMSAAVGR